jgi:hypothetical protein
MPPLHSETPWMMFVLNRVLSSFPQGKLAVSWTWASVPTVGLGYCPRQTEGGGNETPAMSLKDHSDTWVNATFISHFKCILRRSKRESLAHSWSPRKAPWQVRLVLHKGSSPSCQAEFAGSSICMGGRATTQQDLSYSWEEALLARRESLDAST